MRSATSRDRLLWGGRATSWSLLVPVTFFLAGLLFATSAGASRGYDLRQSGAQSMADLVLSRSRDLAARQEQANLLQEEVDGLTARRNGTGGSAADLARLARAAAAAQPAAGLSDVEGPVLEVSLNDSTRPLSSLPSDYSADSLVVHQQDVQAFVNAMWRGGAEAMMIQDQRVVSTSAVRCVGNTLILQGRVYSPPFVVRAIGDVRAMRAAIDADPTVVIFKQYVDAVGLRLDVNERGNQRFPAFDGSMTMHYATVAP